MEIKKISHVKIKPDITVDELIKEFRYGAGFGARNLAKSVDILSEMIKDDDCTIFLGLAGAMVPGGMRQVIIDLIENNYIDVLICTGATLTHDIIEAYGFQHFHGSAHMDDKVLAEKNLNRIYNVLLPNEAYEMFETNIQSILNEMKQEKITAQKFLDELGIKLDRNSIITAAAKKNIPIFCPGLLDSILGFQIWMFCQTHKLMIDVFNDQKIMLDIAYDSKKRGALIIGGGVPKHFIALAMQVTSKGLDYAIQITTDRPEPGGVSGASLQEAKSWKKVNPESEQVVDVMCDATIALPIILASIETRLKDFKRKKKDFQEYG
ncbi:MAG: deoxyhypusine synthase [Candidatus Helarchaeota archaeon]